MLICDLCRKPLEKGKIVFIEHRNKHICINCIKTCKEIIDDKSNDANIVYLNEFLDKKESNKL